MKKIGLNTPEGQALLKKYNKTIMQNGGQVTPAEILTGSVVTGVDPNKPTNAELEGGEYLATPDGNVAEVVGKSHKQGGEKMNLPEGTTVLSDNIKIGKDIKNILYKEYDIDLKATATFAEAHSKLKKKLGIDSAEEEQERYLNILAKNKEVTDEDTRRVNEQFLAGKIRESESALQLKKAQENAIYNYLYQNQESRKQSGEDVQVEPTIQPTDQMAQNGGQIMYQNGPQGATKSTAPVQRNTATTLPKDSDVQNRFDLPAGKYSISDLSDIEKDALQQQVSDWLINFKEINGDNWVDALSSIQIESSSSKSPVSAKTRSNLKITDPKMSQEEANKKLAETRAEVLKTFVTDQILNDLNDPTTNTSGKKYTEDDIGLGINDVKSYQGPDYDPKKGINSRDYTRHQYVGIKTNVSAKQVPTADALKVNQTADPNTTAYQKPPQDVLGRPFPIATPYRGLPNPLMTTQLNLPTAGMITPIKVSPEEALRENNRGFVAMRDVLNTSPGASVGANIANLLGQTQNVNNQAITEANRQNAQYANQANMQNQQIGANLSQNRTQAMDVFGKENLQALDNTLTDFRKLSEIISTDQINAQREGRQMNMIDALAPQYTFDQFGNVVFTPPANDQFFLPQNQGQSQIYNAGNTNSAGKTQQDVLNAAMLQYFQANQPQA
jgi:hypothetical protein